MASWSDHVDPWSPDPREAKCVPWKAKMPHTYRLGSLWPDGKLRCVHCFRAKGRRYPKPKDTS